MFIFGHAWVSSEELTDRLAVLASIIGEWAMDQVDIMIAWRENKWGKRFQWQAGLHFRVHLLELGLKSGAARHERHYRNMRSLITQHDRDIQSTCPGEYTRDDMAASTDAFYVQCWRSLEELTLTSHSWSHAFSVMTITYVCVVFSWYSDKAFVLTLCCKYIYNCLYRVLFSRSKRCHWHILGCLRNIW